MNMVKEGSQDVLSVLESLGAISPNAILAFSVPEKRFVYVNKEVAKIFGLAAAHAFSPQRIFDFLYREDIPYLNRQFQELQATGFVVDIEIRLKLTRTNYFSCDAYLLSQQTLVVAMLKDITEQKERETFMKEYGARKNTLLEIISHNLKGPLNSMQSVTKHFSDSADPKKIEDLAVYLQLMQDTTSHCINIIGDLLKNEHIESTEVNARKERFNATEKIRVILEQLRMTYPLREFAFQGAQQVFTLTDEVKFLQLMNILISNAIKFTAHGGTISIHIQEQAENIVIQISDDGIGIPESLQPFLFDYNTVAGRVGLEGETSSGIGLSIAKKLVNLMGGSIWFDSKEGAGSNFYISLPKV
jgi:two-component system, OmpR family, sensor histidine kinase VicK